ncbi:MAG: hypothetical protein A2V98_04810 [Planctomycetes bacterium RBG_16_64_12]|nr:MAG: hypothetical protein A2V98_04810 [Planctomycetes bacterium RBG_16_64_12]
MDDQQITFPQFVDDLGRHIPLSWAWAYAGVTKSAISRAVASGFLEVVRFQSETGDVYRAVSLREIRRFRDHRRRRQARKVPFGTVENSHERPSRPSSGN